MEKQVIISVGREYGSGGHLIAKDLAERFGIPYYDQGLLKAVAEYKNVSQTELEEYDEMPRSFLLSRTVRGHSNSPEQNVAEMQFEFLKRMASEGKSFVIVGRCAESVLAEFDCLISIFVLGDMDEKIRFIRERRGISKTEAQIKIATHDRRRKMYHNYYSSGKWGDSRSYDLCINSSRLGLERTADVLEQYIITRMK